MNKIKCVCIKPYIHNEIGDIITIIINESGKITHLIDKNDKKWIFMSFETDLYECCKPLAEMRNEKIDQILDDN